MTYVQSWWKMSDNNYSDLRILKSWDYFSTNKFEKLGLIDRKVVDNRYSYIKPTELMYKLIK